MTEVEKIKEVSLLMALIVPIGIALLVVIIGDIQKRKIMEEPTTENINHLLKLIISKINILTCIVLIPLLFFIGYIVYNVETIKQILELIK